MKIIEPLTSKLEGRVLIEASAGTGKTYTITTLVIRYLLGIGVAPLRLEDILIVTFTKAATAELRVRIYSRILEVQEAFKTGHSEDQLIMEMLKIVPQTEHYKARLILKEAERLMSDANVFTIHSFCQRFLSQNPLDSHLPFDVRLETSDTELKTQAAKQFWREECYFFSERLAAIAFPVYKTPDHVQTMVSPFLSVADTLIAPENLFALEDAVFNAFNEDGEQDINQIKTLLWSYATKAFDRIFLRIKGKHGVLFFDDLIHETAKLVRQATPTQLAHIQKRYQVAMIDEFQDTDHTQYEIFSTLFGHSKERTLLMIGDPKQSIYKFRGADIHTYLQAKAAAEHSYSLGTNYRSSAALVKSVNELFEQTPYPFLNENIPFQPVSTPEKAALSYLSIDDEPQTGITIAHLSGDNNKGTFQAATAHYIAQRIKCLLKSGQIHKDGTRRSIENNDITILVRDKNDATTILKALRAENLPAVYLSDKNKVFKSEAAHLIHLFLKSLLNLRNQELMKQTFASLLYQFTLQDLHNVLHDHLQYESLLSEREQCLEDWERFGIIPMVDKFLHRHGRIHRFRNHPEFDRIMTDIRHVCELLQAQSLLAPTKEALLDWLNLQMQLPDEGGDETAGGSYSLRLESEMNVITIMTIHSSKGLEFPITFVPSSLETRNIKPPFIVDDPKDPNLKTIDFQANPDFEADALTEMQAENMRLLYVALTRAKYYCEIALSENFLSGKSNINANIVYAKLFNHPGNEPFTLEALRQLQSVNVITINETPSVHYDPPPVVNDVLSAAHFHGHINRRWNISSFTQLTRHAPNSYFADNLSDESPINPDSEPDVLPDEALPPSIFTFPKGAQTGTFMHTLFEKYAPQAIFEDNRLADLITKSALPETVTTQLELWIPILEAWLTKIFAHPLLPHCTFGDALQTNALHELEFLFPVAHLTPERFNDFLNQRRDQAATLDFFTLEGMMKGFIDLIFMHEGKFYIIDYKTNHLGNTLEDYQHDALHQAMLDNYYDVQYLIYTVALVRYLRFRMSDFDYDRHFGGVFYLFVRGMTDTGDTGIYYTLPSRDHINALDQLMEQP
ncbi:UvrD-helicase domain-containing protein [Wohlfahrtiimonas chitiniclastica]|uniref:UvrD-helicase domain-containing protein n=1 Tax=Wohlfahrtiimonas chitiniclastica TaxID=400946 RepID=UPI001BCBC293|nr:UvrD-helicase domain-containing protein [Wohlfahrtiimonas chitiniclastica]MBS7821269.1 UvrD-helicase domain-containing protein [Wohlfahrtiimonas chitiniclastica]